MRRRRDNSSGVINHIDLTNLIDVAFTLLIVFMITIPLVEYNVNVTPPSMNATPIETKNESIYVNLNKEGETFFQTEHVNRDELEQKIENKLNGQKDVIVFLRADGACSYSEVINVMKLIKTAGAKDISLITSAEEPK